MFDVKMINFNSLDVYYYNYVLDRKQMLKLIVLVKFKYKFLNVY